MSVIVGTSVALIASAAVWFRPAETCERQERQDRLSRAAAPRLVRFPIEALTAGDHPARRARSEVIGRVVDARGRAVSGVLVVPRPLLGSAGDPLGGGVLTDRTGHFRFEGLVRGEYWFIAIHGAYPFGSTPAMPVDDHLEVAITLDDTGEAT